MKKQENICPILEEKEAELLRKLRLERRKKTPSYQERKERFKDWASRNSQRLQEYRKRRHREKYIPRPKILKTDEEKSERRRIWDQKNRERNKERVRNWKKNNAAIIRQRNKERYQTDIPYRLTVNFRNRLRSFISTSNSKKSLEYLGCSPSELRTHIESKFSGVMSWENYGKYWHIDHVEPCAAFDLTKESHRERCFHYTNLQPLEAIKNLRKNKRIKPSHQFKLL